jgi:hypothetical protein
MPSTDSFLETDDITIQPEDLGVPYNFVFNPCSSPSVSDGALPFGETISQAIVTAHTGAGTNAADLLLATLLNGVTVTVYLRYPSTHGVGTYHLTFVLTLDSGVVMEFDFNHVIVTNI